MKSNTTSILLVSLLVTAMAGCTRYYQIKDPSTGNLFYTTRYEKAGNGITQFMSVNTGVYVSLRDSEITRIKRNVFVDATSTLPSPTPDQDAAKPQ